MANVPNMPDNESVAAQRRAALAAALKNGEPVVVTPTGEVELQQEAEENGLSGICVPDGKLA
jgi:hypothetical protein